MGPCIRRLVIATCPAHIKERHGIDLDDEYQELTDAERWQRDTNASDFYFGWYLPSIQHLITNRTVLPNLQYLDWGDRTPLEPALCDAIINSPIRRLNLHGAAPNTSFIVRGSYSQQVGFWPLQSLSLRLVKQACLVAGDLTPLFVSLLHSCAPTLESLTWDAWGDANIQTDCLGSSPCFPNLRYLRLKRVNFKDAAMLKELVHDGLMSLNVNLDYSDASSVFFADRGNVPGLRMLRWDSFKGPESPSWKFLLANPQVQELRISQPVPEIYLEETFLPLLTRQFLCLKSLWLDRAGNDVSQHSLRLIGQLSTLEKLALSTGRGGVTYPYGWLIDHAAVQKHLQNLRHLKKLLFGRDIYENCPVSGSGRYYVMDNHVQIEEKRCRLMLNYAAEYVEILPHLDWILIGELTMVVDHDHGTRVARPLNTEPSTSIKDVFGWKSI